MSHLSSLAQKSVTGSYKVGNTFYKIYVVLKEDLRALISWLVKINFVKHRIKWPLSSSPTIKYYSL